MSKIIPGYNQKKLKCATLLDGLISFALGPFCKKANHSPITDPKKILVCQSHLIGDVVMATPMLKALRKAYPDSEISLLANEFARDLLEGSDYVDKIITLKFPWSVYDYSFENLRNIRKLIIHLRKEKFDLAIDAQIDMRNSVLLYLAGAKRRLGYDLTGGRVFLTDVPECPADTASLLEARLSLLNYLGIDTGDKTTELPVGEESLQWADSYLKENNLDAGKIVAIHPGASAKEKWWRPENFAKTIDYLNSKGYQPVIIEGPKDGAIVNAVILKCSFVPPKVKSSLKNVVAFLSRCHLVICLDSAAIHLAGAVGTPAIAIYGPQPPELTRPFNDNIEIIWDESFDCRPCEYGHCKNTGHSCMDAIATEAVIQKIEAVLNGCRNV